MSIKNFKLTIQYDGTSYSGWQIQKEQKTVQGTLKQSVEDIIHHDNVNIVGSGRTDSGVHSLGQVMNMKIETNMNDLFAYCRLDTLAMVKILDHLKSI